MEVRKFLEQASENQVDPKHLVDFLVASLSKVAVLYQKVDGQEKPFLARGPKNRESKYVICFTDVELSKDVRVERPEFVEVRIEAMVPFLSRVYRSDIDGLLLDPGQRSRLFIEKEDLHHLWIEYAVQQLAQMKGAWVPTMNDSMLLVEYKKKQYTVAIYTREADAKKMCEHSGGKPKLQSWERIFNKAQKVGAHSLFLHFNLPEQFYLTAEHVEAIWSGKRIDYREPQVITHSFQGKSLKDKTQYEQIASTTSTSEERPFCLEQQEEVTKKPIETEGKEAAKESFTEQKAEQSPLVEVENQREESNNRSHVPTKRSNPYSLKSKKEEDLEIYIGGAKVSEQQKKDEAAAEIDKKIQQRKAKAEQSHGKQEQPKELANQGIAPEIVAGLDRLERATIEGQGMANGWEVCQVLAEIRRIWVVLDHDGNMVILAGQDQSPIVDFFTSDLHAKKLIDEAHSNNPQLPPMRAQLVSTKKLYRALSSRQPIVWINRGSANAWTSVMGDTLPYVMQLMSQMQK